jgi:hypothetical protein
MLAVAVDLRLMAVLLDLAEQVVVVTQERLALL